jgi:hypothetical protein
MPLVDIHTGGAGLDRAADALAKYATPLLREVAGRLFRPRNAWTPDEVRDKLLAALQDPVLIDRTLRALSTPARKVLRLVGMSRQPTWRVRGLLDLLQGLGHADGIVAIQELLAAGMMFPALPPRSVPVASFDNWLQQLTTQTLEAYVLPLAAGRARGEDLMLPDLPAEPLGTAVVQEADGLEWPLRLAVLWQIVRTGPLRRTQQGGFFKRDLDRLRGQPLLAVAPAEAVGPVPDPDLLSLLFAVEENILLPEGEHITSGAFPEDWSLGANVTAASLFAALPALPLWDPLAGWTDDPTGSRWVGPLTVLSLALLADKGDNFVRVADVDSWATKMTGADDGAAQALLLGLLHQLRLVQVAKRKDEFLVRLSPLGRALVEGAKTLPSVSPGVEHTLIVQPNLEIVLFRQGLTPALIARLSRFAIWKTLGLACTLQLTAESVYHGLEEGETLADLVAIFERHGTRELSETVLGSLRSWASKRERVLVYPAAMLLEFRSPANLDRALQLGLVERKATDRIGLIATEDRINYGQFRLVGTRDYLAPEEMCVEIEEDGLTLTVNENRSDLLLDSEVRRFAEPLLPAGLDERLRYRMTPDTLRTGRRQGVDARNLDAWFRRRTGDPLPAAARLLLSGEETPPLAIQNLVVLRTPTAEVADGIASWPETRGLIAERLSGTVLAVPAELVDRLRERLAAIGVQIGE